MRRCNCLIFALAAYRRWHRKGAYFAFRDSHYAVGLHWLVHYRGRWIHWRPVEVQQNAWKAALYKFWYVGRVERTDDG